MPGLGSVEEAAVTAPGPGAAQFTLQLMQPYISSSLAGHSIELAVPRIPMLRDDVACHDEGVVEGPGRT
jgi:hypothetical protein